MPLLAAHQTILLQIASHSITQGFDTGKPLRIDPSDYPPELRQWRATFVTLTKAGKLRGCRGVLQAYCPLVSDVAHNAFATAFSDTRFSPVQLPELSTLQMYISVLGELIPMQFDSEQHLIQQLQPGVDGLVIKAGNAQGTFLPSVWENLSNPNDFLRQLKQKAGLPATYWSDKIEIYRYTVEYISSDKLSQ